MESLEVIKEKRFLITTALEQTWVDDRPVLFLGEWCKRYSCKGRWSKIDAVVQPYHWDDRERLHADYIYLNRLYESVLEGLSVKLNQIHGVSYSLRYWRILVGPWLSYFIHILFDRWTSIKNALDSYEITGVFGLNNKTPLVANDMSSFVDFSIEDEWNEQIYIEIIRKLADLPISLVKIRNDSGGADFSRKNTKITILALNIYSRVTKRFVRDRDVFINATYLTKFNQTILQFRLGQIPQWWVKQKPGKANIDWEQRNWEVATNAKNDFEHFLLSIVPAQIPIVYLEGYKNLSSQVKALPWPKLPKLIFSSNVLLHDVVSMAYAAEKIELGTPLVYGQHGGGYGTALFHFAEEHEVKISDYYLTWGWSNPKVKKIIPIGILKVTNKINRKFNSNRKLLFLTLGIPRYSYRLCSESVINYSNYINRNFAFVNQLKGEILSDFLLRLAPSNDGQDAYLRWHERFPTIKIDYGTKKIKSLMRDARIIVQTYNQTGLLESLALGVPSILFCELSVTPLREKAVPYYAELERVGILHQSAESAALHINNIWDDVDAWWNSEDVQEVIAKFNRQYCNQPKNILDKVEVVLRDAIAQSANKTAGVDKL